MPARLDESLKRAGEAAAPAVDPVADRILARVREALVGTTSEPTKVARFTIIDTLGRGGMGAVYAAYDPVLDRKVALKLLRAVDDVGRERVLREARALARLSHPNVVAVHEVGSVEDVVYIAMELVTGGSLRAWAEPRRSRYDHILRAYIEAGRGLAAAHEAGIVHGDVKPDNLVVGGDGRARVIDFGLARSTRMPANDAAARGGTPAYMAPEQLTGEAATARSDQFSFSAAMYESLYGERPFAGATLAELLVATSSGTIAAAQAGSRVPAWLRRVIVKALAADPEQRYPSMDALVHALSAEHRKRRRRWLVGAGALVVGALGGMLVAPSHATEPRCDADARLGDAWSAARKQAVAGNVAAPELLARLDGYASEWKAGYTEACRATHEQSAMLSDLRVHCLEQRRLELAALSSRLASGKLDAPHLALATSAVWAMPEVASCADTDALARGVPLPPPGPERTRVEELDRQVAAIHDELVAGHRHEALAHAEALLPGLASVSYPASRAAVLDLVGDARDLLGDFPGEETIRREQIRVASEARDSRSVAIAWLALAECVARNPQRLAVANELIEVAANEGTQFGMNDAFTASVLTFKGQRARDAGNYSAALEQFRHALALREKVRGPNHPDVAMSLTNIATALLALGKPGDALVAEERALAIRERAYGPDHPETAQALANLGNAAAQAGDRVRARSALTKSIEMLERLAGPDDFNLAYSLKGLGDVLVDEGKPAEALPHYERALAIWQARMQDISTRELGALRMGMATALGLTGQLDRAQSELERALAELRASYGDSDRSVMGCLNNLANLLARRGKRAEARGYLAQVVATLERTLPDHANLATALLNLAETDLELGDYARALPEYQRSVAIAEKALGAEHSEVAFTLVALGHAAQGHGDHASARVAFERAVPILARVGADPALVGYAKFGLAQELWPTDRPRANTLASDAEAALARAGNDGADDLHALSRWRTTHPAR